MKNNLKNFDLNEVFTSPWALWLISITTAVMMWIYVTAIDESALITRTFTCPLDYRGLDSQAILRNRLSEVDLEIRGTEESMMKLDYNNIQAFVDARNLLPGKKYTINIRVEMPREITLISCSPSQAVLDITRKVTRLMTVETVLPPNIPEGQYIEGVEITPREVNVKGAEDDIVKVGSVRVAPTIEELQRGEELLLPVRFAQSEPFDDAVNIEPPQVRFRGSIARGLPKKRVPVSVRLTGKLDSDYEIYSTVTDPSEVQIEGKAEDLAKVDVIETEGIEISSITANTVIVAPLKHPDTEGVSLVNTSSVKVSIQLSEARAEKMIANIPIELRGTDQPKNWVCSPAYVSLSVEGKPSAIGNFDAKNVKLSAYVDMSDIFMAPVTLPVKAEVTSGDGFRVVRIDPPNVTVNSFENR